MIIIMFNHIAKLSDNIYFGKYICSETLEELNSVGVNYILDLTTDSEKEDIGDYNDLIDCYRKRFPIADKDIIDDDVVSKLIRKLTKRLIKGKVIYIHCKNGYSRSAVIAGLLYGCVNNLRAEEVFIRLDEAHKERKIVKDKFRKQGCPQTKTQREQIKRLLKPYDFYYGSHPFSNFSKHVINIKYKKFLNFPCNIKYKNKIEENGKKTTKDITKITFTFPTSEALFHAFKAPHNLTYLETLENTKTPSQSKKIGRAVSLRKDREKIKFEAMIYTCEQKYKQHRSEIKGKLKESQLRPLFEHTKNDAVWGDNFDRTGRNFFVKFVNV